MSYFSYFTKTELNFQFFNFWNFNFPSWNYNIGNSFSPTYPRTSNNYTIQNNVINNSYNRTTTWTTGNKQDLKFNFSSLCFEPMDTFEQTQSFDIYSKTNENYIKNLTAEMQERTRKLISYANKNGYDVKITSGYRSQAHQDQLRAKYEAQGETKRAAKVSAHTYGKAIDISVYKDGKKCDEGYNLLGEYAKRELGMRWGGDFNSYREPWHFDYDWKKA